MAARRKKARGKKGRSFGAFLADNPRYIGAIVIMAGLAIAIWWQLIP